jgi:replicative DNA helicase
MNPTPTIASKESEMMVLGCLLNSASRLTDTIEALSEHDFYFRDHQIIFRAFIALFRSDSPIDIHLTSEELRNNNKLESVGGSEYLITLSQYAGIAPHLEEYTNIIRDKSVLRQMTEAAKDIELEAQKGSANVQQLLDDAEAKFFSISQRTNTSTGKHIKDIITASTIQEIEDRQKAFCLTGKDSSFFTRLSTGFPKLDEITNGLDNSNLIILAGRPGMGKTAFVLNIAEHVSFNSDIAVGIFSLEMSAEQLLYRMISSQSKVESSKIRTGSFNKQEFQRIVKSIERMKEKPMIIDDQPGLSITNLRSKARRMKEVHNIKLLIIDYLQLLSGSRPYYNSENRQQEISEISRMLKNLARELNIPILCGSQLSRKVEDRTNKRPIMSDLRESGAIEQDADIVIMLYREGYYYPANDTGLTELIVNKNRHGKVGNVSISHCKGFAQFTV